MSTSISNLRLFDYTGQFRTAPTPNVTQRYQTPETPYTAPLTLNGQSTPASATQNAYGVNNQGQLSATSPDSLSRLLSFGQQSWTPQTQLSVSGVTEPYQDYIQALSLSDSNFDRLMQQDRFSILNGRIGIDVQTDGQGGVEAVSLDPRSNRIQNGTPANATFPNQAEITQRAESRQANDIFLRDPLRPQAPDTGLNVQQALKKPGPIADNPFQRLSLPPREITPTITPTSPVFEPPSAQTNAILQNLLRLQPREVDVTLFGPQAQITPAEAKQVGAVKASLGVEYSESFKENLVLLRERLAQEAHQQLPQRVLKARDGLMPLSPYAPSESSPPQQAFMAGSFNGLPQMETGASAAEKKSPGGYIPFRMGQDGGHEGHTPQEQRRLRKVLRLVG